jgi:hypothetical protein
MSEMIRCRNSFGCDEVNFRGKSYRQHWGDGSWLLPAEAMPDLEKVGGFYREDPPQHEANIEAAADALAEALKDADAITIREALTKLDRRFDRLKERT